MSGLSDSQKFEYLQRAGTAQYGPTWVDIQMRLRFAAEGIVDPVEHKWLLTALAYQSCQCFRPAEPDHLAVLGGLERDSRAALANIPLARDSESCADEAEYRARRAAHYAALILDVLDA